MNTYEKTGGGGASYCRLEMFSIFTTAKPFRGHIGVIQRNAIQSWTRLHPEVEIILFGNDEGAAQAAQQFRLRHETHVECNDLGTKRLDYMFARAQTIAKHDLLCYINCDILLMQDFRRAVERVRAMHKQFLMVGRRWDADVAVPLAFGDPPDQAPKRQSPDWQARVLQACLRDLALRCGQQRTAEWIDYFVFSRGLYGADMPPFVLRGDGGASES